MFKILAPVRDLDEVKIFLDDGIREFYGGVIFEGLGRTNARPQGEISNFKNIIELKKAINLIHKKGGKFSLTLNKGRFNLNIFDHIYKLIKNLNIDSFIIGDILLLDLLNKLKIKENIHLSTLFGIINIEGLKFFEELFPNLNFNRFCLERTIEKKTLLDISNNFKGKELEFFIFNGRCKFIEGSCGIKSFIDKKNIIKEKYECGCKIDACKLLKNDNNIHLSFKKMACGLCILDNLPLRTDLIYILKIAGRAWKKEDNLKFILGMNKIIKEYNGGKIINKNIMKQYYKKLNGYSCSIKECMYN